MDVAQKDETVGNGEAGSEHQTPHQEPNQIAFPHSTRRRFLKASGISAAALLAGGVAGGLATAQSSGIATA